MYFFIVSLLKVILALICFIWAISLFPVHVVYFFMCGTRRLLIEEYADGVYQPTFV